MQTLLQGGLQLIAKRAEIQPPCVRWRFASNALLGRWPWEILWPKPRGSRMKHVSIKTSNGPLIVGITGASGVIYGVRLLGLLREWNIETHLIDSRADQITPTSGEA